MFKSIREKLGRLNEDVELDEFEETFRDVYDSLGLQINTTFLEKEVHNIRKLTDDLKDGKKSYTKTFSRSHRREPKTREETSSRMRD